MNLCVYGIVGQHEKDRLPTLMNTIRQFGNYQTVDAVFPKLRPVPWLGRLQEASLTRVNRKLYPGEIGCLLSHRKAWKSFLNSNYTNALILESDSETENIEGICNLIINYNEKYDVIFLGSFNGRTKIKRSSVSKFDAHREIGTPLLNTLYCAYGYCINKTAAGFLLNKTKKICYPVDYWQKWLTDNDNNLRLKVGAVVPEVISTSSAYSNIQDPKDVQVADKFPRRVKDFLADTKNSIVGYFC